MWPSSGHGIRADADDRRGYVLTGSNHLVPDAAEANGFVVDARADDRLALLFVPRDALGLTIETERFVDGTQVGRVIFDKVALPADCILGEGAAADVLLDRLRRPLQIALAAETIGCATELLERTLAYLRTRRQFGRSLGSFQALQHRAVDAFCDVELSRSLTLKAAGIADLAGPGTQNLIAAARARAGLMAQRVGKWAVQMHGAMGFTDECDVGLFLKRIMVLTRLYGTPQAHRRRFADASWAKDEPNPFELLRSGFGRRRAFPRRGSCLSRRRTAPGSVRPANPTEGRGCALVASQPPSAWLDRASLAEGARRHGGERRTAPDPV